MEEIEVPLEQVQDDIHHHAAHAHPGEGPGWLPKAALSSALLAALAAVAALLAGHHSNEAMIDRIRASDHWGYYQAKGIKSAILSTRIATLGALGKESSGDDAKKIEKYQQEQEQISAQAKEEEESSERHLRHHQILARAVTFFQVAIAMAAISVLVRRRRFWMVSLGFGVLGLVSFLQGL